MTVLQKQLQLLKKELFWYLLLMPTMSAMLVLTFYPLLRTFALSLYTSRNGNFENFVGILNYHTILTDPNFWNALYNTFYLGIFAIVLNIPISFFLANLINKAKVGRNLFKILYFLPNVTSIIAVSLVFKFLFYPSEAGSINYLLSFFNIPPLGWLNDPTYAKWVVIVMGLWHSVGYNIIIFLAGLQSIPSELYDAAEVDGASGAQSFWKITIPLSRPIFIFMLIMGTIGALERFSDVYTLGGATGSPLRSLQTIVSYFYEKGMWSGQYGIGAAASIVIFFLILIVTAVNITVTKNRDAD